MDFLKNTYNNMMPRSLWDWRDSAEQTVLSTKKAAVSLLCAACSVQTGSNVSELPYYGRSPPIYPSRNSSLFPPFSCTLSLTRDPSNRQWLHQRPLGDRLRPRPRPGLTDDARGKSQPHARLARHLRG